MVREILVFTPPFPTHAAFHKDLITTYKQHFKMGLVFTGWTNVQPDLHGVEKDSVVLARSELNGGHHPALSTLPRAAELFNGCLEVMKESQPKLIIADYWSIEATLAAKELGITSWTSIPAVIGSYTTQEAFRERLSKEESVRALERLENDGVEIDLNRTEMIFDSLYYPGDANLIYTYVGIPPDDYLDQRFPAPYYLAGNLQAEKSARKETSGETPTIVISLGRRVMSLFSRQPESRDKLRDFIITLTALFNSNKQRVIFYTKGNKILSDYPENWEVNDEYELGNSSANSVLITDGDYNSFHKALVRRTPMVVIPFTNRHQLIGERVEALGIGINIGRNWILDGEINVDNLSSSLAQQIGDATEAIFSDMGFKQSCNSIDLSATSMYALLKSTLYMNNLTVKKPRDIKVRRFPDLPVQFPLAPGQVLFGTDNARIILEEQAGIPRLYIWNDEPYSRLANVPDELPLTLDKYLDALRFDEIGQIDFRSNMPGYTRLLTAFNIFLNGERDLSEMCEKGIEFFANLFGIRILVDHFDPSSNYITAREITHVLRKKEQYQGKTIFYRQNSKGWQQISFDEVEQIISIDGETIEFGREFPDGESIPWEKGVFISSGEPETVEVLKKELKQEVKDLSYVKGIIPIIETTEEVVGIESTVFVGAHNLLSLRKKLDDNQTPYGLLASVADGVIKQNGIEAAVFIVMLMDAFGRTAIAKSDGIQFPEMKKRELLKNAFTTALQQIE
ncbi:hypothetical protein A2W14_04965 [Candidatus Gottesmanbacteria bacterium RBG_16_37_8]|uniref:Uncharacterized protein n=1 Tax=Candidatus Gottesmanbacteria bacterium RBG_16_37_8 TaxID=1798371 RepID=A0A1F5YVE3_9BACT|nr:MAG: hypothetical protein A2W14_04965 [Candidatus Gottesmanbacteria bacterium RBG_16_37_8]